MAGTKENKGSRYTVRSGISFLLLLLIIMSLVSFASLSLVSARADLKLSEKYAEQVSAYHRAHTAAQEYFRDADQSTGAALSDAETSEAGTSEAGTSEAATSEAATSEAGTSEAGQTVSFPAGENLQLTLRLVPEGGGWRVESEKLENTFDYEYDESLHVLK